MQRFNSLKKWLLVTVSMFVLAACSDAPGRRQRHQRPIQRQSVTVKVRIIGFWPSLFSKTNKKPFIVEYFMGWLPSLSALPEPVMQGFKEANPDVTIVRRHGAF